jgi:hypothetical protein
MAARKQVLFIGLLSLLLTMSIIVIVFSATAVVATKEMRCLELYTRSRIEQSPPRPIDCNVEGESVGECVLLQKLK